MILLAVLVGVALTLWVGTVLAVAYAGYQFVWCPWKVVRKDLAAVVEEHRLIRGEFELLRKSGVFGMMAPEELAAVEDRLTRQSRARAAEMRAGR